MPAGGSTGSSLETLLCDPRCPVTEDMNYWETLEVLGNDSYDYEDEAGGQPGSFDYDDPRDYKEWCDWNDADIEEGYYDPDRLNEEGGFVYFKDVFGADMDLIVVASVISEAEQAEVHSSKSPDICSDHGLGPRNVFVEFGDMLDEPDLLSIDDDGLVGTSQASGYTSDPPVSIGVVDSGPGLPVPLNVGIQLHHPRFLEFIGLRSQLAC